MRPAVLLAGMSSLLTFAAAQAPPGPSFNPLGPGTATVHNGAELLAALHANKGSISLAGEPSVPVLACRELRLRRAGLQTAQIIFQDAGADQKSGSGSRCPCHPQRTSTCSPPIGRHMLGPSALKPSTRQCSSTQVGLHESWHALRPFGYPACPPCPCPVLTVPVTPLC